LTFVIDELAWHVGELVIIIIIIIIIGFSFIGS